MSNYSKLKLKFSPVNELGENDIKLINDKLMNTCGCNECKLVNPKNIHIMVTFNYGLNKIANLLGVLENYISSNSLTRIGTLSSEQLAGLYDFGVYVYQNHIFMISVDIESSWKFNDEKYIITDLRGNSEIYFRTVCSENDGNNGIELYANKFANTYYSGHKGIDELESILLEANIPIVYCDII